MYQEFGIFESGPAYALDMTGSNLRGLLRQEKENMAWITSMFNPHAAGG